MNNKEEGSRPEKDTALKEEAKKKLISVSCQLHTQGRPDIEQHLPLRPKRTPTSNLKVPKCAASKNERNFILEKPKREGGGVGDIIYEVKCRCLCKEVVKQLFEF